MSRHPVSLRKAVIERANGLAGTGRATVHQLHLNRQNLLNLRTLLLLADLHPPVA